MRLFYSLASADALDVALVRQCKELEISYETHFWETCMNHPEDTIEIVKKSVINWLSMSGVVSGMRHLIMAQKELNFHKIYSEL